MNYCQVRVLFMWSDGSHVGVRDGDAHVPFTDGIYRRTRAKCQDFRAANPPTDTGDRGLRCQKTRI